MWNMSGVRQLQRTLDISFQSSACDQLLQQRHSFATQCVHRARWLSISVALWTGVLSVGPAAQALERLSDEAIAERMQALPTWTVEEQQLICRYQFENFIESIEFVNQLVEPAELANHHPDLAISYNTVMVSLTTHDADGLTTLDFDLAETIASVGDRPCLDAS